jgi:23S rRNA-/tRNA-specific pseudouridylate synthase
VLQVLDVPIRVLATTETAVVVCKPASMPVHPTGQYRKNSVLGILASQVRSAVQWVSRHHVLSHVWRTAA